MSWNIIGVILNIKKTRHWGFQKRQLFEDMCLTHFHYHLKDDKYNRKMKKVLYQI